MFCSEKWMPSSKWTLGGEHRGETRRGFGGSDFLSTSWQGSVSVEDVEPIRCENRSTESMPESPSLSWLLVLSWRRWTCNSGTWKFLTDKGLVE